MKPHCLILTYPLQGHINPMLQFSKRLAANGVAITLVTTKHVFMKTVSNNHDFSGGGGSISVETISDGYDDDGYEAAKSDLESYLGRFQRVGSESLAELIENLKSSGRPVDCLIYNAFLPWGLTVGKRFGLVTASFFTQPCFVNCIYHNIHKGQLKVPVLDHGTISLPGLLDVPLEFPDLPSFVRDQKAHPGGLELVVNQFRDVEEADFVFVNSVYELEKEVVDWMAAMLPVKTIGPTIPSMYLDKRLLEDNDYGLSIFKPDNTCSAWLDQRASGSVIYVSFGSMAEFGSVQMEELGLALKATEKHFIWAVRSSEEHKLPANFAQDTSERGLIVPWAPQLEVLAHDAIGCFITHCGWNSTLEALGLGVPMVAVPWWSDQSTNAKFVMDVWKMGVRARPDRENVVRSGEIVECVKRVMEGDVMRKNARKWKKLITAAVDEGGSSDRNIREFVSKLMDRGRQTHHLD